jgi:TDG/mug DNA glycosylase family protein
LVTPSARIGTVEAVIARKDTVKPLADRVGLPMRALFVGINPGIRSALTGHHFAGFSNRFWTLLFESGLVPERVTSADDDRLPEWGYGVTNLIARPTPGIDTLRADEYLAGARLLRRKVRKWKPPVMALVGVTLYRSLYPKAARTAPVVGLRDEPFEGARVFVLPNPSGRNANYSYAEMLEAFTSLRRYLSGLNRQMQPRRREDSKN